MTAHGVTTSTWHPHVVTALTWALVAVLWLTEPGCHLALHLLQKRRTRC